jgi:hypothetical protein
MDIPDLPINAFMHIGDRKIKPQGGGMPISAIGDAVDKFGNAAGGGLRDSQGNLVEGFMPPTGPSTQALVDYINPQTGQRVTAPSGGYTPAPGFVLARDYQNNSPSTGFNPFAGTGPGFSGLAGAVGNTIAQTTPVQAPRFLPSAPITPGEPAAGASQIDASIRPFLTEGLQQAQEIFLRQQPQMFQGQTYVSPSEQTLTALQTQENIARGSAPTLQAAQGAFLRGLTEQSAAAPMYQNIYGAAGYQPGAQTFEQAAAGGLQNIAGRQLQDIAGGSMLNANPYQQQMMQAATRPLEQQFAQQVLPGISSLYSKSGRLGSGAMERALGTATEGFGRALGDVTSNLAGSQFQAERGLQQQALGQLAGVSGQDIQTRLYGAQGLQGAQQAALATQLQAAGGVGTSQFQELQRQLSASAAAPQIYAQQFLPSQQLAQIGGAREAIAAQPLQEQMSRFAYEQRLPYEQLSGYLSSVYGSPLGSFGTPAPQQQFTNSTVGALGGALGGGIGGYALGSMLPSTFLGGYGGAAGGALGAIGGGLLGGGFF